MQTKFTWEGFENRKFCVDFKNEQDRNHFFNECRKKGFTFSESLEKHGMKIENFKNKNELIYNSKMPVVMYDCKFIDCSIAHNYIKELERLRTNYIGEETEIKRLWEAERGNDPQKAVEIVQQWSDEHPIEPVATYLDRFKNAFPNAELRKSGAPKLCLQQIQYADCFGNCLKCWDQPYKENDK